MTSTVFCIDYDETVSNTDRLRRDISDAIERLGGEPLTHAYLEAYEAVRAEYGVPRMPRILKAVSDQAAQGMVIHRQLAEIFHAFPYEKYLYPGVEQLIHSLKDRGTVIIFSDGDAFFQAHKIRASSLASIVDSVVVLPNKVDYFDELDGFWPADQYVFIDDKQKVLTAAKKHFVSKATTVLVKQGRYADSSPTDQADYVVPTITDIATIF